MRRSLLQVDASAVPGSRAAESLLGVDRDLLVVAALAGDRLAELADALAERAAGGGQALRSEHDERDDEDDHQFHGTDVGHCVCPFPANEKSLACRPPGRSPATGRRGVVTDYGVVVDSVKVRVLA